jgi:hypothetical protein
MDEVPTNYTATANEVMNNSDYLINRDVEKLLKTGDYYAAYPGRNFYGEVWYDGGNFYCQVEQCQIHVDTIKLKFRLK